MRITGGTLCGQTIKVPRKGVRPTQDRVREALFSILVSEIPDASFLDLYAGSGAVGLEAWSRGAKYVSWVENDRITHKVLKGNVEAMCGSVEGIVCGDVLKILRRGLKGSPFDIVFADPPYAAGHAGSGAGYVLSEILKSLDEGSVIKPEGLFIMEQEARSQLCELRGWGCVSERTYGHTKLCFYRKI